MPRTYTPPLPPSTAATTTPTQPAQPTLPNPTLSSTTFYTTLPLILACHSTPPQWQLIHHTITSPSLSHSLPRLPSLHLLLQLATLSHTLLAEAGGSPLWQSLLSASTSAGVLLQTVQRVVLYMTGLAVCHSGSVGLGRVNSELVVQFKHCVVLFLLQHHTTLRQQTLDDITHRLLPPASLHPTIRAFYNQLRQGRTSAAMTDYMEQHTGSGSERGIQQQWSAYAAFLLRTPTLATLCEQLKRAHREVLPGLLTAPAAVVGGGGNGVERVVVESVGEHVSEAELYEWLKRYRQQEGDGGGGVGEVDVRGEWERIKDGTHEEVVAWMAQRERQREQQLASEALMA